MWISDQWKDFCTLDASNGEKLELWGRYKLIRPDPQAIWNTRAVEKSVGALSPFFKRRRKLGDF